MREFSVKNIKTGTTAMWLTLGKLFKNYGFDDSSIECISKMESGDNAIFVGDLEINCISRGVLSKREKIINIKAELNAYGTFRCEYMRELFQNNNKNELNRIDSKINESIDKIEQMLQDYIQ